MGNFNRNLILTIAVLTVILGAKLFSVGMGTDNIRGAIYSLIHVLIVGAGTYFAIRETKC